jgi:hypothetical protein
MDLNFIKGAAKPATGIEIGLFNASFCIVPALIS